MTEIYALSDVCNIQSGGTPRKGVSEYWGGDIPWVKISDIEASGGLLSSTEECITQAGLKAIRNRIFERGTLLFAMYGSVGKTAIASVRLSTNQAILGINIKDKSKLSMRFLSHWLKSNQARFEKDARGVAQKNLSAGYIRDLKIPLPPLEEQKRIAAILDQADAIRRKRQQAIELSDQFLRSVFLDMFGDPVTNPNGWHTKHLKELIVSGDKVNYGIIQPGRHFAGGIPIVRIGDFVDGRIDQGNLKRVDPKIDAKYKKSRLIGDEILIACVGATIGKVALADISLKGFNIVRATARLRLLEDVNRDYLFRYLQSPVVQNFFVKETRSVGQPTLNISLIEKTPVLIPPADLQKKYSKVCKQIDSIKKSAYCSDSDLNQLFNSISQREFNSTQSQSRAI